MRSEGVGVYRGQIGAGRGGSAVIDATGRLGCDRCDGEAGCDPWDGVARLAGQSWAREKASKEREREQRTGRGWLAGWVAGGGWGCSYVARKWVCGGWRCACVTEVVVATVWV
uniref:Uncharacterized protein n=1 Tax=Fagus sylvatica TaxID=28930 RepID=A0A2N9EDD1_FAGSY